MGGQWPRGPLCLGGPAEGPWAREGAHRNDTEKSACEAWRPFICSGDHMISTGKTVRFSVKTFFFCRSHYFSDQQQHFLRLFWISQNRNSVIFELAPGPLLVPGISSKKRQKKVVLLHNFAHAFNEWKNITDFIAYYQTTLTKKYKIEMNHTERLN